ncbi:septation protein A [soil metagenome]
MKMLFDLLPVIVFFAVYWLAKTLGVTPDHATRWFGWLVHADGVSAEQLPILFATVATIIATALQVAWQLIRRRKVAISLWLSFGIVTVLGGATVWLQDENFIKWKPTVIYLAFAIGLAVARYAMGRNVIQSMMSGQVELSGPMWDRLNLGWIGFFIVMAIVNIAVAYSVSTSAWVNFKLFGITAMLIGFAVLQAFWISRHIPDNAEQD